MSLANKLARIPATGPHIVTFAFGPGQTGAHEHLGNATATQSVWHIGMAKIDTVADKSIIDH